MPANLLSAMDDFLSCGFVGFPGSFRALVMVDCIHWHAFGGGFLERFQPRDLGCEHGYPLALQFLPKLRTFWLWWRRDFRQQHAVFVGSQLANGAKGQNQHISVERGRNG